MAQYQEGDRIRLDIADKSDPDFRYNDEPGTITNVFSDDAGGVTGDERDSHLYDIELDSGEKISLRWRDIRPLLED